VIRGRWYYIGSYFEENGDNMLGAMVVVAFLFPLIDVILSSRRTKQSPKRRLELIAKRLAEKEQGSAKKSPVKEDTRNQ